MARLIEAPLDVTFSIYNGEDNLLREFNSLSESDDDPVGQWLKLAKAKGETSDSDQIVLTLLVELHRKVDDLTSYIKNEKKEYLELDEKAQIDSIGFDNFHIKNGNLQVGVEYYGRILMPIFPKREVALFFVGEDKDLAKIKRLHERDRKDWNSYVTARERVMIRQMRANKNGS